MKEICTPLLCMLELSLKCHKELHIPTAKDTSKTLYKKIKLIWKYNNEYV